MKTIVTLSFNSGIDFNRRALVLLGKNPDKLKLRGLGFQNLILEKASPEYATLTHHLSSNNVPYTEFLREEYDPNEVLDEELFWAFIGDYWGNPEPPDGFEGAVYESTTACTYCGNGAVQKGSFRIRSSKLPKARNRPWLVLGMANVDIVSNELAEKLKEHRVSGWHLLPILDYVTEEPVAGWGQLVIDSVLSPLSSATRFPLVATFCGDEEKHPGCNHIGRNIPETFVYNSDAVVSRCDFNLTAEFLGGGLRTYRQRIISGRVLRLLLQLKLRPLFVRKVKVDGLNRE